MVELTKILAFAALLFSSSSALANGSSGVGNAHVSVTDLISGSSLGDKVRVEAGKLIDTRTGKPFLSVFKVPRAKVDELQAAGKIFPSTFGKVHGFEFVPSIKDAPERRNFWVICEREGGAECTQLLPAPGSPLTAQFIGTLRLKSEQTNVR